MRRLPRLALLVALVAFAAGCRSSRPYAQAPEVPEGATTIVLTDNEPPRVLYAEAWGAFAEFGWTVVDSTPAAFRLRVRPEGYEAALDVFVEEDVAGGRIGSGRLVARVDSSVTGAHDVLRGAARALATVPGRIELR